MIVFIFAEKFHFLMKLKWFPSNLIIIAQHKFGAYLGFLDNRKEFIPSDVVIPKLDFEGTLNQVEKFRDQRLLFKILSSIRFFSENEIREKLKLAHNIILRNIKPFIRKHKSDRRKDLLVTYVDNPGKSGSYYAARYAEENLINSACVVEQNEVTDQITKNLKTGNEVRGLIIIDDIVATGAQLSGNAKKFLTENIETFTLNQVQILVIALVSTKEGEEKIRKSLSKFTDINVDFRICEPIDDKYLAFKQGNRRWLNNKELEKAKALCWKIGAKIYKRAPLGYGNSGLLIVFPKTCPNNSLPILHSGDSNKNWRPIFPRSLR
jgi:hypothetical protein